MMSVWDREKRSPLLGATLLGALVTFRVLNALVVRTSFTPDEFWQGPEPAHLLAFGTGHLTWEWEPSARIRGFTHPLMFASVYKALQILGLDTRWAVAHSPKLLQGAMAGVCDFYTFGLALRVFGAAAAGWALLFQVLSWFNFYCLVRPYSNSAEAVLATAALFHWAPFFLPAAAATEAKGSRRGVVASVGSGGSGGEDSSGGGVSPSSSASLWWRETCALLLASLCIAVRPTSAALWAVVGLFRLSKLPLARWPRYLTLTVLPPVAAVVGASFYLDSQLYGTATLVPLNFLRFNVLEGKSRIFGEQAWHWNFSQGLPAVLGAALPAALWGFWRPLGGGGGSAEEAAEGRAQGRAGDFRRLGWLAVWFLVYHSTSPHKEFRFLLPVLPIAHAYAGQAVSALLASAGAAGGEGGRSDPEQQQQRRRRHQRRLGTAAAVALFALHVPAAVYLSVWHQSGALSAVDAVARRIPAVARSKATAGGGAEAEAPGTRGGSSSVDVSVHFLMPCHSAPLHSHLHFRGEGGGGEGAGWSGKPSLWSLDCSPKNRELPGGSESDKFQADPLAFLESTYGPVPHSSGAGEKGEGGAQSKGVCSGSDGVSESAAVGSPPPDIAVIYDTHLGRPGVADYLSVRLGLHPAEAFFNAHVNGDADSDDTHRSVHVLERVSCARKA
ncbi:unnamed protein product [Scytosiphon promiscuus]